MNDFRRAPLLRILIIPMNPNQTNYILKGASQFSNSLILDKKRLIDILFELKLSSTRRDKKLSRIREFENFWACALERINSLIPVITQTSFSSTRRVLNISTCPKRILKAS